jgi:hypothetical protein
LSSKRTSAFPDAAGTRKTMTRRMIKVLFIAHLHLVNNKQPTLDKLMQLIGVVLLYLVGLCGSEYI